MNLRKRKTHQVGASAKATLCCFSKSFLSLLSKTFLLHHQHQHQRHKFYLSLSLSLKMPLKKKNTLKTIFTPVMICGCGCGPTRTGSEYTSTSNPNQKQEPKPEKKRMDNPKSLSPLHSPTSPFYSSKASPDLGPPVSPRLLRSPCPKIDESVAMAKESVNPFEDFRASMKQMIEERDIESEDDLKELLRCFLDINPPPQHNVVVRAFVDVCSSFRPPNDRRGKSLGRLLRLYVNPVDDSHQALNIIR
ncbi:PREDICTED: transcription repressor OFP10 [Tarenaya hassleriana]|uniref:transcription repressor OFP10 n=1 Tax=Tarenaya hassleriana TaxID=28532 RepID=UPI00053C486E|nr:PREDICTED: transcription repressor OFP10 [Tarenaya hassleriana]